MTRVLANHQDFAFTTDNLAFLANPPDARPDFHPRTSSLPCCEAGKPIDIHFSRNWKPGSYLNPDFPASGLTTVVRPKPRCLPGFLRPQPQTETIRSSLSPAVSTQTPCSVKPRVCSTWALESPSRVTTVQWSRSTLVLESPIFSMGSTAKTNPGSSRKSLRFVWRST